MNFRCRATLVLALILAARPQAFAETATTAIIDQTCGDGTQLTAAIDSGTCNKLSTLMKAEERNPSKKVYVARQRARTLADTMETLLTAEGYYAATVTPEVDVEEDNAANYLIVPGKRFKVTAMTIEYTGSNATSTATQKPLPTTLEEMGLALPLSPRAEDITATEQAIQAHLNNHGRPWAKLEGHEVRASFTEGTATVVFRFNPGEACVFGDFQIEGAVRLDEDFIGTLFSVPDNKPCSLEFTRAINTKLARSGLFAASEVKIDETPTEGHTYPVHIRVKEAKARTVGLGLSYATNTGAGGHAYWEHRNLLGRAERLRFEIKVDETKQEGAVSFRKPLPRRGASLLTALSVSTESFDAYDANRFTLMAGVEQPISKLWTATYGVELEAADVSDPDNSEKGETYSLPLTLTQSTIDTPLDTRDGVILTLTLAPSYSTFGDRSSYVKADGRIAWHRALTRDERLSFGTWLHTGTLFGAATSDISATKLYFGGGANSVRAIAFEHLSDIDADGVPLGGRSTLEGGIELRRDILENWQVVGFIEGGRTFRETRPDFDQDMLWGGGIGVRYKTPVGPLRLDIAAPVNPRDSDEKVLFYIGLGQAF